MKMDKMQKVIFLLKKEYGTPQFDSYPDPLDELIITILSQNTSWQNCRRAFDNLKENFKTWKQVASADTQKIARAIKIGGLSDIKAGRIKEILKVVYEESSSYSLLLLKKETLADAHKFLVSLKGVGPKTAACVLLFSCRKPILPVDTHILRISKRLGLIPEDTDAVRAHELLGRQVPHKKETILTFHVDMIQHGRTVCKSQKPRCRNCILKLLCPYGYAQNNP
jgi:endonuclease-3